jgi:phage shock protein E
MQNIKKAVLVICFLGLGVSCSDVQKRAMPDDIRVKAEQAQRVIEMDSELVILDVRTPEEYAEGHLPGAILMNYFDADFKKRLEILDKDKHYLVYCRSGGRSGKATAMMQELGFYDVLDLEGGIGAWKKWGGKLQN